MNRSVYAHQLYQTTRCAFLIQEKNSLLGVLWHLLNPLAISLVLYIVFSNVGLFSGIPDYPLYILTGIVHFNFFSHATTRAATGIADNRAMVLNSTAPLELIVVRAVLVEAVSYAIELGLVVVLVALFGDAGLTPVLLLYPVVFAGMVALTTGCGLLLAALVVFLSDLAYVWGVVVRMLFFLTPIFYSARAIDNPVAEMLVGLNPLAALTMAGRDILLYGTVPSLSGFAVVPVALVILAVGALVFARLKRTIPDYV